MSASALAAVRSELPQVICRNTWSETGSRIKWRQRWRSTYLGLHELGILFEISITSLDYPTVDVPHELCDNVGFDAAGELPVSERMSTCVGTQPGHIQFFLQSLEPAIKRILSPRTTSRIKKNRSFRLLFDTAFNDYFRRFVEIDYSLTLLPYTFVSAEYQSAVLVVLGLYPPRFLGTDTCREHKCHHISKALIFDGSQQFGPLPGRYEELTNLAGRLLEVGDRIPLNEIHRYRPVQGRHNCRSSSMLVCARLASVSAINPSLNRMFFKLTDAFSLSDMLGKPTEHEEAVVTNVERF